MLRITLSDTKQSDTWYFSEMLKYWNRWFYVGWSCICVYTVLVFVLSMVLWNLVSAWVTPPPTTPNPPAVAAFLRSAHLGLVVIICSLSRRFEWQGILALALIGEKDSMQTDTAAAISTGTLSSQKGSDIIRFLHPFYCIFTFRHYESCFLQCGYYIFNTKLLLCKY